MSRRTKTTLPPLVQQRLLEIEARNARVAKLLDDTIDTIDDDGEDFDTPSVVRHIEELRQTAAGRG